MLEPKKLSEFAVGVDEVSMFSSAVRQLRLIVDAEVFQKIAPTDCIEIFDSQLCQIYRSFNFFDACNYSLEELASLPWTDLYSFSPDVFDVRLDFFQAILSGRERFLDCRQSVPTYEMTEIQTQSCQKIRMQESFLATARSLISKEIFVISVRKYI